MTAVEVDLAALCWEAGTDPLAHAAQHEGGPCPYFVAGEVFAGRPDPRRDVVEWQLDLSAALKVKPAGAVPLSLNDRGMHWAAKATAIERVKRITRQAVQAAQVPHLPRVHVVLMYRPATNRFRDVDNIVATQKPAVDALHQPAVGFEPIIDGDDPRYVTWSQPVLLPWAKGAAGLWLVLRSYV